MNACTLWPDRFLSYDLSAACAIHDSDFANQVGFMLANKTLYKNVKNASNPIMAAVMWLGVSSPVGYFFYWKSNG